MEEQQEPVRFISVDDHPAIAEALRSAAADDDRLELLGSFGTLEAVPKPLRHPDFLDVVLLDLSLPGERGLAAVDEAVGWGVPVLVFSATARQRVVDDVLAHGAAGFVGKSVATDAVLDAVRAVAVGDRPVLGVDLLAEPAVALTSAEQALLGHLCLDTRSKQLARRMGVSPRTVDNMVTELYRKLELEPEARTRASLRDWARQHGFGGG